MADFRVTSFADLAPLVCVRAGFIPTSSLAVMFRDGPIAVIELGELSVDSLAESIARAMLSGAAASGGEVAAMGSVVFGDESALDLVEAAFREVLGRTPPTIVQYVEGRVRVHRLGVREWDGEPLDLKSHPIALAGAEMGVQLLSRAERAAVWTVGTDTADVGAIAEAMLTTIGEWTSIENWAQAAERAERIDIVIAEVIAQYAERNRRGRLLSVTECAELLTAASFPPVRDNLLGMLGSRGLAAPRETAYVWGEAARRCPENLGAGAAVMAAVAAYLSGDGAAASMAIDSALAADRDLTVAELMRHAFGVGIPPHVLATMLIAAGEDPANETE